MHADRTGLQDDREGGASWRDAAPMVRVLAGAAPGMYGLEGEEAAEYLRDMEAIARSAGKAAVLTNAQIKAVNDLGAGMAVIAWHGRFEDLTHGRSQFAREMREELREGAAFDDDEAEEPAGAPASRASRPTRPIEPGEVAAFIQHLQERDA